MYNFIFYFIYKSQINQKDGGPFVARYIASLIVFVVIGFHFVLSYSIIRFISFHYLNMDISTSSSKSQTTKFFNWLPIFIPGFIIVFKYFTANKILNLTNKYQDKRLYSFINILKFICMIFIPLIIAIVLVNYSRS